MKVRFRKLTDNAQEPRKAHMTDAGFDLVATRAWIEGDCICYGTGIAMEIPDGYVGLVFPRSSNSKKNLLLTNSVGVIDSGYRGEILFKFWITKIQGFEFYNIGDRIGQIIIMPYPTIEFEETDELSQSDRGEGGYGSTGR